MVDRVRFRREVGKIMFTRSPFQFEVFLGNSVLDPMVSHRNGFGTANFGRFIGNRAGGGVIICDFSGLGLRMAEVRQIGFVERLRRSVH